jgi:hypothetical protein
MTKAFRKSQDYTIHHSAKNYQTIDTYSNRKMGIAYSNTIMGKQYPLLPQNQPKWYKNILSFMIKHKTRIFGWNIIYSLFRKMANT